jgi:hypothetical protein
VSEPLDDNSPPQDFTAEAEQLRATAAAVRHSAERGKAEAEAILASARATVADLIRAAEQDARDLTTCALLGQEPTAVLDAMETITGAILETLPDQGTTILERIGILAAT